VVGCWRGYLSGARCKLAYGIFHCHSLSLASVKSSLVFPEKWPLNGCVCVCACVRACVCEVTFQVAAPGAESAVYDCFVVYAVIVLFSYESMRSLCDRYNRAIDSIRQLVSPILDCVSTKIGCI